MSTTSNIDITLSKEGGFKRSLGLFDGVMLVTGIVIGSGIFLTSAEITRTVGGMGWVFVVWIVAAFMTIIGALCYGELAALFPHAGGQYVYLRRAYNPLVGFLYGWAFFAVIQCGSIAAVAVAFSKYLSFIFPVLGENHFLLEVGDFHISFSQGIAILLIVLLTFINTKGVKNGKLIQGVFTVAKVLAIFLLIIFGFWWANNTGVWQANWTDPWKIFHHDAIRKGNDVIGYTDAISAHGIDVIGLVCVAMVGSLFTNTGWNNLTYIAAEVKRPHKNIGRSLLLGTLLVTVIYLLCNAMYMSVLTMQDIAFAQSDRVAAVTANVILGSFGAVAIAMLIMVSTFGSDNGLILSGPRVYYSMAEHKLFFRKVGRLNKSGVPAYGLWIQCVWASILCLSGRYSDLLSYVIFVEVLFYMLTIGGIFILRKRLPDQERAYKAPGYPVLPAIYILLAVIICLALVIYRPLYTWPGLIIIVLGLPVYYFVLKKGRGSAGKEKGI